VKTLAPKDLTEKIFRDRSYERAKTGVLFALILAVKVANLPAPLLVFSSSTTLSPPFYKLYQKFKLFQFFRIIKKSKFLLFTLLIFKILILKLIY